MVAIGLATVSYEARSGDIFRVRAKMILTDGFCTCVIRAEWG